LGEQSGGSSTFGTRYPRFGSSAFGAANSYSNEKKNIHNTKISNHEKST
jgi:hypothetical protein